MERVAEEERRKKKLEVKFVAQVADWDAHRRAGYFGTWAWACRAASIDE